MIHLSALLDQAPAARRGIGGDLAVLAAWLHGHGLGALLESYRPIARRLTDQPTFASEALDVLPRAPASPAWTVMRQGWLEAARRYFRHVPVTGRMPPGRRRDAVSPGGLT